MILTDTLLSLISKAETNISDSAFRIALTNFLTKDSMLVLTKAELNNVDTSFNSTLYEDLKKWNLNQLEAAYLEEDFTHIPDIKNSQHYNSADLNAIHLALYERGYVINKGLSGLGLIRPLWIE